MPRAGRRHINRWLIVIKCPAARANKVHDVVKRTFLVNSLFGVHLMTNCAPKV
jgi:hypothetical protein